MSPEDDDWGFSSCALSVVSLLWDMKDLSCVFQSLVQNSRKAGITSAMASSTLNNEELVRDAFTEHSSACEMLRDQYESLIFDVFSFWHYIFFFIKFYN